MQKLIVPRLIFSAIVLMPGAAVLGQAITAEGDVLRGEGIRAAGVGWYNFNTARANAINVGAMRNYNEEVRLNYRNRVEFWAKQREGRKISREEADKLAEEKLKQLETNPTNDDIKSGEALNVLVSVLTDPNTAWNDKIIQLPEAATLKDMVFVHYPNKIGPNEAKVLVALSRLGEKIEWPLYLTSQEFNVERNNFVVAVTKLRKTVAEDRGFDPKQIDSLEDSLKKLKEKIDTTLDDTRGFRAEGRKFHKELTDSTKLFDGKNIDWAKEILYDTERYDAKNVPQLIAFMRQYRLHFADADTARSTALYGKLYTTLKNQASQLGNNVVRESEPSPKPEVPMPVAPVEAVAKPIDYFTVGSKWSGLGEYTKGVNKEQLYGHAWELEVTKRTDENFEGTISYYGPNGKTPGKFDITGRAPKIGIGKISFGMPEAKRNYQKFEGTIDATGKINAKFTGKGPGGKQGKQDIEGTVEFVKH